MPALATSTFSSGKRSQNGRAARCSKRGLDRPGRAASQTMPGRAAQISIKEGLPTPRDDDLVAAVMQGFGERGGRSRWCRR